MNETANATLQLGGSPVMAHENSEMTNIANSVVLNMGTLDDVWLERMKTIGHTANMKDIPVVFDPVGAGATKYRTDAALLLLKELTIAVLRGNEGEIASLYQALFSENKEQKQGIRVSGVDSVGHISDSHKHSIVQQFAASIRNIVAMTGKYDVISNGNQVLEVHNNHSLLSQITGTGCTVTALIGAFIGVAQPEERLLATAGALAYFNHAAERAGIRALSGGEGGPGSFSVALMDELFAVQPHDLVEHAKIVEV